MRHRGSQQIGVPLIAEHDTWISLDPLVGCPADCTYCYLGPLKLRGKRPTVRVRPQELIIELKRYLDYRQGTWGLPGLRPVPICIGNYTDMFMTRDGVQYLQEYLPLHAEAFPDHPLCMITKARLNECDVAPLDQVGHPILASFMAHEK